MKRKEQGVIQQNHMIIPGIYQMVVEAIGVVKSAVPGQFINLYCNQGQLLLPRPVSICQVDSNKGTVKLVYGVVGKGTKVLSQLNPGDKVSFLGPLGRGFELSRVRHHLVIGGGIGVPPLLELVKHLRGDVTVILGFRGECMLVEKFEKLGAKVQVASEDGSCGKKGTVMDIIGELDLSNTEMIYSCGPKGMLKAVAQWAEERRIPAQLSLEERMACGIGACLVCTCKIAHNEGVDWEHKRVCKDGPVFWRQEVIWDE